MGAFNFDDILADRLIEKPKAAAQTAAKSAPEFRTLAPVYPADPRPDIEVDHKEWDAVLCSAWTRYNGDNPVYGLLHGLRCGGARLTTKSNGSLHLDYSIFDKTLGKTTVLEDWLKPNVAAIKGVFSRAEALLSGVSAEPRKPVWMQ